MDFAEIKQILEIMQENDISEFELERDGFKLSLKKGQPVQIQQAPQAMMMPVGGVAPQAPVEPAATPATEELVDDANVEIVVSQL